MEQTFIIAFWLQLAEDVRCGIRGAGMALHPSGDHPDMLAFARFSNRKDQWYLELDEGKGTCGRLSRNLTRAKQHAHTPGDATNKSVCRPALASCAGTRYGEKSASIKLVQSFRDDEIFALVLTDSFTDT